MPTNPETARTNTVPTATVNFLSLDQAKENYGNHTPQATADLLDSVRTRKFVEIRPDIIDLVGGAATALDSLTTAPTTGAFKTGHMLILVRGGLWELWSLTAGTNAEDTAGGIVRPDDYNGTTNQKVWIRLT